MSLNKYLRISSLCLVAALAFSACAKKNNDLAARLKNPAGATATSAQTNAADAQAAAMGVSTDFQLINNPVSSGGSLKIVSRIIVGQNYYDISTMHNTFGEGSQPAVASTVINGATFQVSAVCATAQCSPYYIIINITGQNGQQIKQMAMMKFFYSDAGTENDIYYSRTNFLTMPQAIQELKQGVQVGQ